jgi:hypothetical protein
MAARFAAHDDALAKIVRQQEDLAGRMQALDSLAVSVAARGLTVRHPQAEGALKDKVADVTARLKAITAEIDRRYPEYWALVSPAPVPLAEVQALLGPEEALLASLLITEDEEEALYVWLIKREQLEWQRVPMAGLWSNLGDEAGGGVSSVMDEITVGRIRHGEGYRRWAAAARRGGRG